MARSLSNARIFSAYFANGIAKAIPRRGCAAAAEETSVVSKVGKGKSSGAVTMRFAREEEMTWMPDPLTGVYRPGNRRGEIDAAELRAMMLKKKDLHATA